MCSSGTQDAIDTIPNENVLDSGVDDDQTVEPNVMPVEPSNIENHSTSIPQVDSDTISIATVVEPTDDHTIDHMPNRTASAEPIIATPKSINLDDLPLHSPSSQIVGTPFAIDNTRFEYPFPDANQTCSPGSSSATSEFSSPTPSTSTSTSSQILTQLSFPPPLHHLLYNATHPKMKVQVNPPIPPNLVKRRLWSLNLLGRRKSSAASQQSTASDESTTSMTNIIDGQQTATPPGSPVKR